MGKALPAVATSPRLLLAEQHHRAGRLAEAEHLYRQILRDDPADHQALHRLALLAHQLGHHQPAVELLEEACRLQPSDAALHRDLGMVLQAQGRHDMAASCYRAAVALQPDHAAWSNLGQTLYHLGRFGEAEAACREAMRLKSDHVEACNNLGLTLLELGRAGESIALFQRVLALQPELVTGRFNLGTAYEKLNRLDEAADCYRQALAAAPGLLQAHHNLGNVLLNQGRIDEALACFDRALALQPDFVWTYDIRLHALNYLPERSPAEVYQACHEYAQRIEAPLKRHWQGHANGRDPERRLKVGYVSADLRLHSVAFFIEPILAQRDHDGFEIYCYYNNTIEDAVTARLRGYADHWVPCRYLTDEQLAARIRADGIDILLDLAGHTAGNRLSVFARKPAPVQVTYLGYVATTGLAAMDWRLSHLDTDPDGYECYNSERLYRLPHSLWCYRPAQDLPPVAPVTPARTRGYPTFGSLNNIAKVSAATIATWAALLKQVPAARLVMAGVPAGTAQSRVRERFVAQGVAPERLELHDKMSHREFRELHGRLDLALDPFPHNGNTTTCESLYLGVPVVTLIGDRFVGRFGYHLLKTLGLTALAARDAADYVRIAAGLAGDLERLEELRTGMRARLEASALRDEIGFTQDLEAAYRAMWRQWCAS
jgi:predicted O-linked N-acetylglucosamine transferase (SPINDLY family)